MKVNVDFTDVARHAIFNDTMTGIQRVQIEVAKALYSTNDANTIVFSNVNDFYDDLDELFDRNLCTSNTDIYDKLRRRYGRSWRFLLDGYSYAKANAFTRLNLARHTLLPSGRALRFGSNDVIYVGGAFWTHGQSIKTYETAAKDGCDLVVLFHDLIPLMFPGFTCGKTRAYFERILRLPARTIAISRFTQLQIELARDALRAPPNLLPASVIPLAHEFSGARRNQSALNAPTARTAALDRIGTFVLCVGTIDIRKNQKHLIHLWEVLARDFGNRWPKLVVAGKPGSRADDALLALGRANNESPYLWIDAPTDNELAWLYARTSFTVFPSLAEGWGLPVGESLWFGKPCVASNTTSIPEVGGDLCAYGDPHAINSFALPIIRLVRDAEFYASSVARIKESSLRTWAQAASEIAACVLKFSRVRDAETYFGMKR